MSGQVWDLVSAALVDMLLLLLALDWSHQGVL